MEKLKQSFHAISTSEYILTVKIIYIYNFTLLLYVEP